MEHDNESTVRDHFNSVISDYVSSAVRAACSSKKGSTMSDHHDHKAFACNNYDFPCGCIVFATSRGKARSIAAGQPGFEGLAWIEIEVQRIKAIDDMCDTACVLDWHKDARTYYEQGWSPEEGAASCDCCGLYQYDEFPESTVKETEDGDMCLACIAFDAAKQLETPRNPSATPICQASSTEGQREGQTS